MATRKTSDNKDVKTSSDVSKKTSAGSKASAAKQVKTRRTKKAENSPNYDTDVLNKANINPLDKVLEIKARNEEIKTEKALKKATKKNIKTSGVVDDATSLSKEKGVKIPTDTKKRRNVIESAQKTAERKFAELKAEEDATDKKKSCCLCKSFCSGAFGAWANAYKNIFNFKGRTSRYEFWSFMLINFFVILALCSGLVLFSFNVSGSYNLLSIGFMALFLLAQFIINLALSVRRIHDTGNTAWKGFYRPLVCTLILGTVLVVSSNYYLPDEISFYVEPDTSDYVKVLGTSVAFFILFAFYLYYLIKVGITVCFVEEDSNVLESGEARYADVEHKKRAMKYAAIYFVVLFFYSLFSMAFLSFFMTISGLYGMYGNI